MHRRARSVGVPFVTAALALLVPGGCLPDLDPTLLLPGCAGGAQNGALDDDEECDDGTPEGSTACDARCRIVCSGAIWRRKDGGNDHCYTVLPGPVTADAAEDACRVAGGFRVTIRSDDERAFVAKLLAGAPDGATFHTAYVLDAPATVTFGCGNGVKQCTVEEAIPDPITFQRQPGILSRFDGATRSCSGCYGDGLAATWWTAAGDRLVVDRSGTFAVKAANFPADGAVCERPPPGDPPPCNGPSCAADAATERTIFGSRWAWYPSQKSIDDAELTCQKAGGHLAYFKTEHEREAVLRYFVNELTPAAAWVGLRSDEAAAWTWSDGVADQADGRPSFWAIGPFATPSQCAAIILGPGATAAPYTFAEGLVRPFGCVSGTTPTPVVLPFLCRI
jgi:hypothetical protein